MALRQLIPALFVVAACSDSTPRNLDTLIQDADIYLDSETMEPYSGPVAKFAPHDGDIIEMKAELVDGRFNGKLDGPYERLTDFGDVFESGIYHNGEQCGEWIVQANLSNYDTTIFTYPPCPTDR